MNNYEKPQIEIIKFNTQDIITTSGEVGEDGQDDNILPSL